MGLMEILLAALYPRGLTCDHCGQEARLLGNGPAAFLCQSCLPLFEPAPVLPLPTSLDGAQAGLLYNNEAARLMRRFKYGRARYLAETFAAFMHAPKDAQLILPVPLFPGRKKRRGYNQSELLARVMAKETGLPVDYTLLMRVRNTPSQTALAHDARVRNVRGAFRAKTGVRGLNILLIDDVFTTGATMAACAEALKAAGAARVYALAACAAALHALGKTEKEDKGTEA